MKNVTVRRGRTAALVVLLAACVAVPTVPTTPAEAWQPNECHWGTAPAAVTYENIPLNEPGDAAYRPWFERGIQHWNATMEGQLKFSPYPADSVIPVDFYADVARMGANYKYIGEWQPAGCREYSGGPKTKRWIARSRIAVNRDKADWIFDTSRYSNADPEVIGALFLHEIGHSVGLDHTSLHTGVEPGDNRTFSMCNIMYYTVDPFLRGNQCQGAGDSLKPDDITGAMLIYEPDDPPEPPHPNAPSPIEYFPKDLCSDGGFLC